MKIGLTCPRCGGSNWFPHDCSHDEDGVLGEAYECASCGDVAFPEDMVSAVEEDK